jgi:hypothetical protein
MLDNAFRFRPAAKLFALASVGYALIAGYLLYLTEPGRFTWQAYWQSSSHVLFAVFIPLTTCLFCTLLLFAWAAARSALIVSAVVCASLILSGWVLMALPILAPVAILTLRIRQVTVAREPVA